MDTLDIGIMHIIHIIYVEIKTIVYIYIKNTLVVDSKALNCIIPKSSLINFFSTFFIKELYEGEKKGFNFCL
jgi:hypothetical protein